MKELDLLLLRWLKERWPSASATERAGFEAILALPDPELAAYLMGREIAPPALDPLIRELRGP